MCRLYKNRVINVTVWMMKMKSSQFLENACLTVTNQKIDHNTRSDTLDAKFSKDSIRG